MTPIHRAQISGRVPAEAKYRTPDEAARRPIAAE
jgi:hypothetical protein